MRVRSLRWLVVFGCAAIVFGAIGYSVSHAQVVEPKPEAEVVDAAEESMPPEWSGSGEHPGKALFDANCRLCHTISERQITGPGLLGIGQRVSKGPAHGEKSVVRRLLDFIKNTRQGGPDSYSDDPYFRSVQENVAGPGVQMSDRGGLPADVTDRDILNIIDYILRFRDVEFDEKQYWREYRLGKALVSGESPFEWGGPACSGCHSVGADLQGANIGANIAHTYVRMREIGKDEKNNFTDGLREILSGKDAPKSHYYYKDEAGSSPLTDAELKVVATYFEQAARETGTEHTSNYLPIFALLFAALFVIALEPGIVNILFAKEHGEYIDGPYKEDDHHDHGPVHEHRAENAGESEARTSDDEKPASDEMTGEDKSPKSEEKPAEEAATEGAGSVESRDTEHSPKPEGSEPKSEDEPGKDKKEDS